MLALHPGSLVGLLCSWIRGQFLMVILWTEELVGVAGVRALRMWFVIVTFPATI